MSRPAHDSPVEIDLCSGAFWAGDHHPVLAWMRAESPVHYDGNVWGVSRYADIKDISRQPETFSNAGGIRPNQYPLPMMIDMDDPAHLQRRKLVNRGFTPRRVRDSEPQVRQACTEILDAVRGPRRLRPGERRRRPPADDHDRRRAGRATRSTAPPCCGGPTTC